MALRIADLWRLQGRVGRRDYSIWGVVLFVIKYNLDRIVSGVAFGQSWYPWFYLLGRGIPATASISRHVLVTLSALSLPFIYIGVSMTLRRLTDAKWPRWLVIFFFVPFVNVLFIAALCLQPTASIRSALRGERDLKRGLARYASTNATAAAALGLLATSVFGILALLLSVRFFQNYAWGVFVGIPFLMGFSAASFLRLTGPQTWNRSALAGILSVGILAAGLFGFAVEGALCIAMAVPIAMPLAILGSTVAWVIYGQKSQAGIHSIGLPSIAWVIMPLMLAIEAKVPLHVPEYAVTSSCVINAQPADVWTHVISFNELPPPRQSVFLLGIAYPLRARLDGKGVGAIRYCEFSTGPFIEPITVWDENRRLGFNVTKQPRPMREWSPYSQISPAHLEGFFRSQRGEFRLVELPGGRTRLEGTTWYKQDLAPQAYWRLWSDYLVHAIHERVLEHIKRETEGAISSRA